jgi:prenyltransferase/squalene oxidase-like repeat protein
MNRIWLTLCLLACAGCAASGRIAQGDAAARGARYLWSQQSSDGGWHSRTYGLLRSGESLTPFVLDALLHMPDPPAGRVSQAIDFIQRHTESSGAVGRSDPSLDDYPNYATAYAVQAICRASPNNWRDIVRPMVAYLRSQQFVESNGWTRDHPVYGAWGMGGERRTPPHTGHVDLSMTRTVLQALAAAGVSRDDPAMRKAIVFLDRCRNSDGGFHFSTVVLDANKAGRDGDEYRSYGTATADGIVSMLSAGVDAADPRVRAATDWLLNHHSPEEASGFVGEAYSLWKQGLRFYYASQSAEVFSLLKLPTPRYNLEALQRPDGSWSNPEKLVKEDDPLIATSFALRALSNRR